MLCKPHSFFFPTWREAVITAQWTKNVLKSLWVVGVILKRRRVYQWNCYKWNLRFFFWFLLCLQAQSLSKLQPYQLHQKERDQKGIFLWEIPPPTRKILKPQSNKGMRKQDHLLNRFEIMKYSKRKQNSIWNELRKSFQVLWKWGRKT